MTDTTALDSFLDKWRSRWPEWRVVEVFVPVAQRPVALAWFSLLQEFTDAMNIAGDPLPADAKLAWWGEELRDWQQQRSRHPLGRVLEPHRAPWFELAEALPALIRLREQPRNEEQAFETAMPLATAIAEVERVLFAPPATGRWTTAVAAQLLAARLEGAGAAAIPVQAGTQPAPSQPDWAARLLQHWPTRASGPLPRRLASALARTQLQRFKGSGEPVTTLAPPRALWLGWRAARDS
ncbi:phytoene/squalene synthase family protein [Pseudoxanthomonas gei]|uniref:Phytoene/squalene synthase family protein n=1 Tax=Pseudoxanthomonas gei TaxID=1383030 RepID=A0ABX0AAF0_9GAMM|nr:phytoene/squalene synthase family protein [Pseudoxanthomonas gei]NDK37627.1 phytoene/squalene synthase family protein [Pseudoxanthomonas gei]